MYAFPVCRVSVTVGALDLQSGDHRFNLWSCFTVM